MGCSSGENHGRAGSHVLSARGTGGSSAANPPSRRKSLRSPPSCLLIFSCFKNQLVAFENLVEAVSRPLVRAPRRVLILLQRAALVFHLPLPVFAG